MLELFRQYSVFVGTIEVSKFHLIGKISLNSAILMLNIFAILVDIMNVAAADVVGDALGSHAFS